MKFLLIGGFLGAGKTSFLLQLAQYMALTRKVGQVAILENEIGQVGVDDKLLQGAGYQVTGLFSGCVCCTMAGELAINVRRIMKDLNPDWIIMEATGVAFPGSIRENLQKNLDIEPEVICLTDAKRWMRLLKPMAHLLPIQLKDAHGILINKADLVDAAELEAIKASVAGFNDTAWIEATDSVSGIDPAILDRIIDWEPI